MSGSVAVAPTTGVYASQRWVLALSEAIDRAVCGGKAVGLATLRRAGVPVPDGICLTTDFCRAALREIDVAARVDELAAAPHMDPQQRRDRLAEIRRLVETAPLPTEMVDVIQGVLTTLRARGGGRLAVRSSAVHEDRADASHAGMHVTFIGPYTASALVARVKACWASLWSERAWAYREHFAIPHTEAAMAVVVQRFVAGGRAGIAFSADPMTAHSRAIVIEAAWGTGEAVVAGTVTPEHYRLTAGKETLTLTRSHTSSLQPVLTDGEIRTLARLVTRVERVLGVPVDVEWTFDGSTFWVVQGRPLRRGVRHDTTLWTRANLKEVFPDQPSPLAVSYLSVALNRMFREYNCGQGYELPPDMGLVGVFRGRPYLNLTLMNAMTVARGGRPEIVARLFGGAMPPPTRPAPPTSNPVGGMRPGLRLARELLTTVFLTPRRAQRMFLRIRSQAQRYATVPLARLDDAAMNRHLVDFAGALLHPATLRRLHEIVSAQSRAYMILDHLLRAWIPAKAERLLAQLVTGLGTLPNARLTYQLMALSDVARAEPRVQAFFANAADGDALRRYRSALAGSRFLAGLNSLLREFGHRGPFESDVMSPRYAEDPQPLLLVIQTYLRMPALERSDDHEADRRRIREAAKREARLSLQHDLPWLTFPLQWTVLSGVCTALQRLVAGRDENRHVTTLLVAHLRRVALEIGRRAVRDGRLATADDIFFVSWDELPRILTTADRHWRDVVAERRRERARDAMVAAPDLLCGDEPVEDGPRPFVSEIRDSLRGFGVSPGKVRSTVKIIRSKADLRALSGEIVVLPAIEPSLATIFPVVGGLVAEMGGVLSHASILAREYGLPAVVNVKDATRLLRDGDRIELNGTTGRIRLLGRRLDANGGAGTVTDDQRRDGEADDGACDYV